MVGLRHLMVVSDRSTDGTDQLLTSLALRDARITFIRHEPRAGKTAALSPLLDRAPSEIIILADANLRYGPDTVRRLIAPFADPDVGYAPGRILYVNPEGSLVGAGYTAEMRYENAPRALESTVGPVVGVNAIRCSLYGPMRPGQLPDFVLSLVVVDQGCRVVYVPEALLEDETLTSESAEYRMCLRVALRGPPRLREFFLARYCYHFLLLNWASAAALVRFLRGEKQVLWQPRTG